MMTDNFVIFFLVLCLPVAFCIKIDVSKTVIEGPGLIDNANLPVRYIYIHSHDSSGKPISKDLNDGLYELHLESSSAKRVRAWRQVLNLHNGTYIARFRLYDFGGDLKISITHQGKQVAKSPYHLKNVYGDECYCPMALKEWTKALNCPSNFTQIEEDFKNFDVIDLNKVVSEGIPKFAKHHSFCHYVVKKNTIFRQCHGRHTDFKMFMDGALLSITKKVKLPNLEFLINLGDWPLERDPKDQAVPLFSWCGSKNTLDIVLPTYDLMQSTLEMLGRVSLDIFSVQANTGPKWENKIEKGFFRGRDSRQERLDLAEMSVKNPDDVDAAITNYFFFKQNDEKYGKKVKHIGFFEFFKHKYQLNIDGTVAAYRLPYLFTGDALVFKQESEYYEHFYNRFKPWEHYVPVQRNLKDVLDKIKWAREHDDEARRIQQAATKLARELLTPDQLFCYYAVVMKEYAKRQTRPVKVLKSMEEVKHKDASCVCHRRKKSMKKDEL